MKKYRVAIDGPAGSGKSTIAREIATDYHIIYVDTGAMYRTVAYKCITNNKDTECSEEVVNILNNTEIKISWNEKNEQIILMDGTDVTSKIRTPEVSIGASNVAKIAQVRQNLVAIQQEIAKNNSVIMDGRDIGTHVLTDAEFKFFLTASPEERAKRRTKELELKGINVNFNEIVEDIKKRDYEDSHREHSPLRRADDAIEIDTTYMNINEVINCIKGYIEQEKTK